MNPFYERRSGRLQIGVSDNMNFPAHLHDDVEMIYCMEGEIRVSVMGETRLLQSGECAVIFPERVHSYTTEHTCKALLLIFGSSLCGKHPEILSCQSFFGEKGYPSGCRPCFQTAVQKRNKL